MASAIMRIDADILREFLKLPDNCTVVPGFENTVSSICIVVDSDEIAEGTKEVTGVYTRRPTSVITEEVHFRRFQRVR